MKNTTNVSSKNGDSKPLSSRGYGEDVFLPVLLASYKDKKNTLREPQVEAYKHLAPAMREGKNLILAAPTAFGKSKLCNLLMNEMSYTKLCIVAVPKLGISRSFQETEQSWYFDGFGRIPRYGFTEISEHDMGKVEELSDIIKTYRGDRKNIILTSHSTLTRALRKIQSTCPDHSGLLRRCFFVTDEAHHIGHSDNDKESNALGRINLLLHQLGVQHMLMSATINRHDGVRAIHPVYEDRYVIYRLPLADLHSGFSKKYVPDIHVGMRFYSKERIKKLLKAQSLSTEKHTYITNLKALEEEYWQAYKENPVPTLIQAPYAVLGQGMKNCEIALDIEKYFLSKNPNLKILNLGGTMKRGYPMLTSELSERVKKAEYDKLKLEDWDIVISVAVMEEGMDWVPCERIFLPHITTSAKQFIQRDLGRGARMYKNEKTGYKKKVLKVLYFIAGLSNKDEVDDADLVMYCRKIFIFFSLNMMGDDIYGRFNAFPKKMIRAFRRGQKDEPLDEKVYAEVMTDLFSEMSLRESQGEEWTRDDTKDFIIEHKSLVGISDEERFRIIQKMHKIGAKKFKSILEWECSKLTSKFPTFEELWDAFPAALKEFGIEDCLGPRGRDIARMMLPVGTDGKRLHTFWKAWRKKFSNDSYWKGMLVEAREFFKEQGRKPCLKGKTKKEREIAVWWVANERDKEIREHFRKYFPEVFAKDKA